jgi:hypothetical protein
MVFSSSYHSGADGIPFDVTHSIPKMGSIHHNGMESILPEMAGFGVPGIEVLRIVTVNSLKRPAERILASWHSDQMNMECRVYFYAESAFTDPASRLF